MRYSLGLMTLLIFCGCSTSRPTITKSIANNDAAIIKQMTEAIDKRPDYFLSNISLDTIGLAHYKDSLGFNYTLETGGYKLNDRVYFWMSIIRKDDNLISFSASPFYWTIGGKWERVYNQIYRSVGWIKYKYGFSKKYFNYKATLLPLETASLNESMNIEMIDSMMTPFNDYVYHFGNLHGSEFNYKKFEKIASKLNSDELYYLLNSINPATRAYTVTYVSCNKLRYCDKINKMVEKLLNESTRIKSGDEDIIFYLDLKKLINCE